MSGFLSSENPVMQLFSKLFDLILLGGLWLVCSLPVITIGASTTAMYTVLLKLTRDEDYAVLQLFFQSFKDNFKQATLIWVMLLGIILFLAADFFAVWLLSDIWFGKVLFVLLSFLSLHILGMLLYAFPGLAYFENTTKDAIKNSFLFPLIHPVRTVLMLVIDVAVVLIVLAAKPLILFMGVLVALPNAPIMNKVFAKYAKEAVLPDDETDTGN